MATLQLRGNKWRASVRIPVPLKDRYDGKLHFYRTMKALDRPSAKAEADVWEARLEA